MSWVNPDAALRTTRFDDYVIEGWCLQALNVIKNQLFVQEIHTIGYCVEDTLLPQVPI